MNIKKNDNVIVITGKDKGKTGKVMQAFPRDNKIIVEGVNIHKRHRRATREGQKGQIIEMAFPMHVSNVRKADQESAPAPKKAATKTTKKKTAKAE